MLSLMKYFLDNWRFTLVVSAFVVFFGITGALNLTSETFPSVNIGAVVITTPYDGATAEDIETKITKPIEDEIQRVSGLKRVKSTSQAGLSTIVTEVDIDRYDVETVIADLQRAVDRTVGLPTDLLVQPTFTEIKSDEFPVIEVAVVGPNTDRLRDRVADALREDIKDNKAVSAVRVSGDVERRFNILLDQRALQARHVSITEVQAALALRNLTIPGGALKTDTTQTLVRIEGKVGNSKELEAIVVRSNFSGQKILLGDVAKIDDGSEDPVILAAIDGKPATLLVIAKKGGADIINLAEEITATIESYRQKYAGQLDFVIYSSEGVRVGDRLAVLYSNGWQGILLVVVLLLIFLPGRVGLVTSVSLPLALAATLGAILALGYTLNTITIVALVIAIGMLVDNAVVVSENFTRLRDEGLTAFDAALKTLRDLWAPVTATCLTTIAAFLPMLVTTGVMGQFIKAIPIVVSLALLISLAEGFFLLPTRLALVGYKTKTAQARDERPGFFERYLVPVFERQIAWLVDRKWLSSLLLVGVIGGTIGMLAFVNRFNLFPSDQTEIYIGRLQTANGNRVEETARILGQINEEISKKLGDRVKHVVAAAGQSAYDASDPKADYGANTAMVRVFVTKEAQDTVPTAEVLEALRTVKHPEAVRLTFEALVNGPPVGDPVTVTFRSNDLSQLNAASQHMVDMLGRVTGVYDAKVDDVVGEAEIAVRVDYAAAARVGLTLQEIGSSIRTAVAGQKISDVNLDNRTVDYFLRLSERDKASIDSLAQIKIADRMGNLIPLGSIATFDAEPGRPQIKRYDFRRAKTVTASLDDTATTSIKVNQLIAEEFDKVKSQWPDVGIVFGGEAEKTNESVASLLEALVLSAIGIFALLVLIFRSYLSPFIILMTIPLGLVGVALAFFLHQRDLSFMALVGVVGLGGIIVNSGIILISFIEQMRQETDLPLREILIKASSMRLRAVLVTSLTTIGGLVPTAYGIGGVDYFIIPMALALAWGIATGTILTLYFVPPLYALTHRADARHIGDK
jgi:multidrug efflux pump subunit AcrB